MPEIAAQKAAVRGAMLAERRVLADRDGRSARIVERCEALAAFAQTKVIATYISTPDEADTRALIKHAWEHGVTVLAPAIAAGHLLRWSRIESFDLLAPGPYGILEPPASAAVEMPPPHAVAIVPCVAFDAAGYRLGWGKGYYDRFLDGFDGASIALAFDCQEVPELPRESHDQRVDYVVTETRTIDTRGIRPI